MKTKFYILSLASFVLTACSATNAQFAIDSVEDSDHAKCFTQSRTYQPPTRDGGIGTFYTQFDEGECASTVKSAGEYERRIVDVIAVDLVVEQGICFEEIFNSRPKFQNVDFSQKVQNLSSSHTGCEDKPHVRNVEALLFYYRTVVLREEQPLSSKLREPIMASGGKTVGYVFETTGSDTLRAVCFYRSTFESEQKVRVSDACAASIEEFAP